MYFWWEKHEIVQNISGETSESNHLKNCDKDKLY